MGLSDELKIFSGRANSQLAQKIAEYLNVRLGDMKITSFNDG